MEVTRSAELNELDLEALCSVAGKLHGHLIASRHDLAVPVDVARRLLKARRERAELFGAAVARLMGEAVYDILLDLYVAYATQRTTSVSSACIASGVPATTAQRAIQALVDIGVVIRTDDKDDRRRRLLLLADETADKVVRHLRSIA